MIVTIVVQIATLPDSGWPLPSHGVDFRSLFVQKEPARILYAMRQAGRVDCVVTDVVY
jgi:hypothetical protein